MITRTGMDLTPAEASDFLKSEKWTIDQYRDWFDQYFRPPVKESPEKPAEPDKINPPHYRKHPSGVECIQITEHFNFCKGNAIKYIWRAGEKQDEITDLKKAKWYIDREISRIERERASQQSANNG